MSITHVVRDADEDGGGREGTAYEAEGEDVDDSQLLKEDLLDVMVHGGIREDFEAGKVRHGSAVVHRSSRWWKTWCDFAAREARKYGMLCGM